MTQARDMDQLFAELRSLLHAHARGETWGGELAALVELAHEHDPRRYREQWLPYLSDDARPWPSPLITTREFDRIEQLVELLPGATFALGDLARLSREDMARLPSSPGFPALVEMDMALGVITRDDALALLDSEQMPALRVHAQVQLATGQASAVEKFAELLALRAALYDHRVAQASNDREA